MMRRMFIRKRRGFTLTELAIVLLVVGVIISAIWVAAGSAWDSYRVYRTNQQIAMSVMNIRDFYTNVQVLPAAGDITAALDALNMFPPEMRRRANAAGATPVDHALNNNFVSGAGGAANGSFHVASAVCPTGAGLRCFTISLMGLTRSPCIKLLTSAPIADSELGVVKIGAQNMASSTTVMTTAIRTSIAEGWCNVAGDTNEVDIMYKLHN